MPQAVDKIIEHIMRAEGVDKGEAIARAKKRGLLMQKGAHLAICKKHWKGNPHNPSYGRKGY